MKIYKSYIIAILIYAIFNIIGCLAFAVNTSEKNLMDEARLAYESRKLDKALEIYNKIPQKSDFWIEALEEKTWTQLRMNKVSDALATITTLTSDLLSPQIGPEPYFLKAIINYKLCNIKGVLEDFAFFKKRFQSRSTEIEKLANTQSNSSLSKALSVLKAQKSNLSELKADDFGPDIQFLPRYFYRDKEIIASASNEKDSATISRISQLAKEELKEIETILQKMHLLESQLVQQVFAYNKELHNKRKSEFTSKSSQNILVFPFDKNNDIWLDELDSFEAATNECPVDPFKGDK